MQSEIKPDRKANALQSESQEVKLIQPERRMVVVRSSTVREREEVGQSIQTFKFKIKKVPGV